MLTRLRLFLFSAALLTIGLSSQADPITYSVTGTGSGSLGGTSFTNASFSLFGVGDTSNISLVVPGIYVNPNNTATVSVTGLGSALFTDVTQVADNQNNQGAGFGDNSNNLAIAFDTNSAFASYNLATDIGPISGSPAFNPGGSFNTTSGNFILNSISGNVTFQATTTPVSNVTPEGSSVALLVAGVLPLAFGLKRRFRRA